MKITCEHVVRCGNNSCGHNKDGYEYCLKVVALDTTGKCAFIKPISGLARETAGATLPKGSNAC